MKKYENLAKAFYDIGKYTFTALVVGQFVTEKFNWIFMLIGLFFTILTLWFGQKLEQIKEDKNG
ncbi:MAG: hypothetical protein M1147_13195 [Nitrospirae bacterium]|nr:hypothetical protein [Nitrospirota bacterium]MCL5979044.1 hypothetical protein [Nitrospirota bacterium]